MNPNQYDTHIPWIPPQNQNQIQNLRYRNTPVVARNGQQRMPVAPQQRPALPPQQPPVAPQQAPIQKGVGQKPKRMSKARTVMLARTLKRWLVIVSIVSFGSFSGLVAFHQVGSTTTTTQAKQSSNTTQATPTTSTSSNNGFFNQQGGSNLGSSNSSQGTTSNSSSSSSSSQGSTNGSSTTPSAPVTGSRTS